LGYEFPTEADLKRIYNPSEEPAGEIPGELSERARPRENLEEDWRAPGDDFRLFYSTTLS
jgi:hypothetical protein